MNDGTCFAMPGWIKFPYPALRIECRQTFHPVSIDIELDPYDVNSSYSFKNGGQFRFCWDAHTHMDEAAIFVGVGRYGQCIAGQGLTGLWAKVLDGHGQQRLDVSLQLCQ